MNFLLKFILGAVVVYLGICVLLYFFQEKVIFFPQRLPDDYRFTFQNQFEEVYLKNHEMGEAQIHGLHFFSQNPKGVILYFHGNAGSLAGWGEVGSAFTTFGYDVFIPDYRGFGKSKGKLSQEALFSDARLCYDYLRKKYPPGDIVILRPVYRHGRGITPRLSGKTQIVDPGNPFLQPQSNRPVIFLFFSGKPAHSISVNLTPIPESRRNTYLYLPWPAGRSSGLRLRQKTRRITRWEKCGNDYHPPRKSQ